MTITYPQWWRGFRWDMARLMNDLFTHPENMSAVDLAGVKVERAGFLADNASVEQHLTDGNGILLVHRNGGQINKRSAPWVDEAIVTLAGLTFSADESNKLMDYVTAVLSEFEDGGTVYRSTPHLCGLSTTFMKVPGEVVGPQLIPEQFRDDRLVPMVWQICTDIPRGLPNYRDQLGLDTE